MKKLNDIIKTINLTVYGFPAFAGLAEKSNKQGSEKILSTLSPSIMMEKGIKEYYAPVLPRGSVFTTTDAIIAADLDCNIILVQEEKNICNTEDVIIASRHAATIELLSKLYINNKVLESVNKEDIAKKVVVGTLPPHLIQYCKKYIAVTISDFDQSKDGDMNEEQIKDRIAIHDPISVIVK